MEEIDKKCKNYWNGNCSNNKNELIGACDDYPNCYYKQLKQLEEKYNKMVDISKENLIKYEDLRLDNQKLIMEIENLKSQFEIETLKNNDTNECVYRSNLLNKYKHALEEIREMLPESKCKYACFSCPESGQCKEEWAEPIRRIISEAIGE